MTLVNMLCACHSATNINLCLCWICRFPFQETKAAVSAGVSAKSSGISDSAGGSCSSGGSGGPLLNIPEPRGLGAFRGGSLPNVAQGTASPAGLQGARRSGPGGGDSQIDLADALNSLESMKRGDVSPGRGRSHHRQRAATASSHQRVGNTSSYQREELNCQ